MTEEQCPHCGSVFADPQKMMRVREALSHVGVIGRPDADALQSAIEILEALENLANADLRQRDE